MNLIDLAQATKDNLFDEYVEYIRVTDEPLRYLKWKRKWDDLHTIEALPDVGWVVYSYAARLRGELGL